MRYAEVCVNSTIPDRRTFSYSIPDGLSIDVGQAVWVPFGTKLLQGVVLELTDSPAVAETKDIIGVIEPRPILSPAYIAMANWLSKHYLAPIFDSVALMLPPGFEIGALTFLTASIPSDFDLDSLDEEQRHILELIEKKGKSGQKELEKALGQKKAQRLVAQLVKKGLVQKIYDLEPIKVSPKFADFLKLTIDPQQAEQE